MVKALYDDFECAVVDGQDTTEWFKIKTGVKQGCNMSGLLFLLVVDWVMRNTLQEENTRIRWKLNTKLEDLDFADDIALLSSTRQHIQTWKMNQSAENKIDVFQSRSLGRIFKIRWQERITNKEILKMAEIENLSEDVRRRRWKLIGHIMRKEPNNDCRTALTWAPEGRRKRGRPRTTWRRTAEREMEKRDGRTEVRYK